MGIANSKPSLKTLEVTLIGTGGGYGESIVVHLGNSNWIVIDSCKDPYTKKCLPLEYLMSIGVNISTDVKLVLATHWHDDHIRGISEILYEAKSSKFAITDAGDRKKFLLLVGIDSNKAKIDESAASTLEFKKCNSIVRERKSPLNVITKCYQDRRILDLNIDGAKTEVWTLSPSDQVIQEFAEELSTLIKDYGSSNRKIIWNSPNDKSVAILIKANNHRILLGSDLEVKEDNRKGWHCILDYSNATDEIKADLYKIPHHGSENGYHEKIFEKLVNQDAVTQLTPWNKKNKLPKPEMVAKYLSHSSNLYSTSTRNYKPKPKKRSKLINNILKDLKEDIEEIRYNHGILQNRIELNDSSSNWETKLSETAKKIMPEDFTPLNTKKKKTKFI